MGLSGIPLYVVAGRIVAFLGMGLGASLGIFLLVGGLWLAGIIALALFPLSLGLLLLVEWLGERSLRQGARLKRKAPSAGDVDAEGEAQ